MPGQRRSKRKSRSLLATDKHKKQTAAAGDSDELSLKGCHWEEEFLLDEDEAALTKTLFDRKKTGLLYLNLTDYLQISSGVSSLALEQTCVKHHLKTDLDKYLRSQNILDRWDRQPVQLCRVFNNDQEPDIRYAIVQLSTASELSLFYTSQETHNWVCGKLSDDGECPLKNCKAFCSMLETNVCWRKAARERRGLVFSGPRKLRRASRPVTRPAEEGYSLIVCENEPPSGSDTLSGKEEEAEYSEEEEPLVVKQGKDSDIRGGISCLPRSTTHSLQCHACKPLPPADVNQTCADRLIQCEQCDTAYHPWCLSFPLPSDCKRSGWRCNSCSLPSVSFTTLVSSKCPACRCVMPDRWLFCYNCGAKSDVDQTVGLVQAALARKDTYQEPSYVRVKLLTETDRAYSEDWDSCSFVSAVESPTAQRAAEYKNSINQVLSVLLQNLLLLRCLRTSSSVPDSQQDQKADSTNTVVLLESAVRVLLLDGPSCLSTKSFLEGYTKVVSMFSTPAPPIEFVCCNPTSSFADIVKFYRDVLPSSIAGGQKGRASGTAVPLSVQDFLSGDYDKFFPRAAACAAAGFDLVYLDFCGEFHTQLLPLSGKLLKKQQFESFPNHNTVLALTLCNRGIANSRCKTKQWMQAECSAANCLAEEFPLSPRADSQRMFTLAWSLTSH